MSKGRTTMDAVDIVVIVIALVGIASIINDNLKGKN